MHYRSAGAMLVAIAGALLIGGLARATKCLDDSWHLQLVSVEVTETEDGVISAAETARWLEAGVFEEYLAGGSEKGRLHAIVAEYTGARSGEAIYLKRVEP